MQGTIESHSDLPLRHQISSQSTKLNEQMDEISPHAEVINLESSNSISKYPPSQLKSELNFALQKSSQDSSFNAENEHHMEC